MIKVNDNAWKADYIVKSLSKIKYKSWELYVVSRFIHTLDDLDVEFVCQQLVIKRDGGHYLVDIYFPQFDMYLEVDEGHHLQENNMKYDKLRQQEILEVSSLEEYRISIFNKNKTIKALQEINNEINNIVEKIKSQKIKKIKENTFIPWRFEGRYDPSQYIKKGVLEVGANVILRKQVDVINLFGKQYKGWMKGWWEMKGTNYAVWFPRLYRSKEWTNSLSVSGDRIEERKSDGSFIKHKEDPHKKIQRIVFGHYKNVLGQTVYKFVGIFEYSKQFSTDFVKVYNLVSDKMDISNYHNSDT